jgi:hypothetical protein
MGYKRGSAVSIRRLGDTTCLFMNNALRFFRDNESGGPTTEHAAGSVARIWLYDGALSAAGRRFHPISVLAVLFDDRISGIKRRPIPVLQ